MSINVMVTVRYPSIRCGQRSGYSVARYYLRLAKIRARNPRAL